MKKKLFRERYNEIATTKVAEKEIPDKTLNRENAVKVLKKVKKDFKSKKAK